MKTMCVDLWAGQVRGSRENFGTRIERVPVGLRHRGLRELFVGAYATFADPCRAVDEPGLALVAVDEVTGRATGLARVRARVDRHVTAIVGRHDACDLFLDAHASLALRHLAVIVDPVTSWRRGDASVRYRILDLRTTDGFVDEHGRTLRGLRCEGPALVRCAGYAVFLLPLGDPTDWPASADDAWAFLPERVYFDEKVGIAVGTSPRVQLARPDRRATLIRTTGPRDHTGVIERGDLAGTLEVIGPAVSRTLRVGHAALADGILLGRYARCDGTAMDDDNNVSRVHALLIQLADTLMAFDLASSNGTSEPGQPPGRVFSVRSGTELQLGDATLVRWR
ncbi:MAG: Forkhead-associated protein [Myxococcales bacterium]|nr:Forkhead-associated protein [Myxococcales bacterium]